MTNLPAFLERDNPLASKDLRDGVHKLTGGDPDKFKLNSLLIRSESPVELDAMLKATGFGVERLKIYSGYAPDRSDLEDVIAVSRQHGVTPYIGGGIFDDKKPAEIARTADKLESLGIDTVEVSNDAGKMKLKAFRELAKELQKRFSTVLVEVGRKDHEKVELDDWMLELEMAAEIGASDIVFEGGGNGDFGIYTEQNHVKSLLLALMHRKALELGKSPVIEAATLGQSAYLVACSGLPWNTRIANVDPTIRSNMLIATYRQRSMTHKGAAENDKRADRLNRVVDYAAKACRDRHYSLKDLVNDSRTYNICMCLEDYVGDTKDNVLEAIRDGGRGARSLNRRPSLSDFFSSWDLVSDDEVAD